MTNPHVRVRRALIACTGALTLAVGVDAQSLSSFDPTPESAQPDPAGRRPAYRTTEILVRPMNDDAARELEEDYGLVRLGTLKSQGVYRYGLPEHATVPDMVRLVGRDARVDYAEPNHLYYLTDIPNDSFYDNVGGSVGDLQKWYHGGIGADDNLNAEEGWDKSTGRSDVVIAIIDSGIQQNHEDLAGNLWSNVDEIPGNSIDDDANGFVDDTWGWDFVSFTYIALPAPACAVTPPPGFVPNNDPNPHPGDGCDNDNDGSVDNSSRHGTAVASAAGADGDNGLGIAGASWDCQLMACQVFADDGGATTFDISSAIDYASANGADVLNMSFGSSFFSITMNTACQNAYADGAVLIASAGNDNSSTANFPATFDNVLSVGASDSGSVAGFGSGDIDGRASFSQYGPAAVDVVAPGADIAVAQFYTATQPNFGATDFYTLINGTSFSSPIVAGLAALIISHVRDGGGTITNAEVVAAITSSAIDLPDDPGDSPDGGATWDGMGRVDFCAALSAAEPLSVELQSFEAKMRRIGVASLRWETAAEIDTAGFNVFREPWTAVAPSAKSAAAVSLNASLIPARGHALQGAAYRWMDLGLPDEGRCYYWLEDVDLFGVTSLHGPFVLR